VAAALPIGGGVFPPFGNCSFCYQTRLMADSSSASEHRGLLRGRGGHEHGKVSFVELFFDLVFVFAVTQLSHSLIEHFTPLGAVQTLLMMLAVWWVWIFTSWVTNWLNPEKLPVRLALLVLMLFGLILSSSVPEAFESRGLAFAGAYAAMQVGRTLFFIWAVRGHPVMVRNFQRILVWLAAAAVFWLAGASVHGMARVALWAVALATEYASPSLGFFVPGLGRSTTKDWDVQGEHMAERCALFIIIALGESILVTGAIFSALEWTPAVVAAFVSSFVGSLAMWWLYFDTSAAAGSRTISSSYDPGKLSRVVYTYIHLFIVGGIIVAAVADEFVLHHPTGHSDFKTVVAALGSTALYLVGNLLFKWTIAGKLPVSHVAGLVAVAMLAPVAPHFPPFLLSLATSMLLIVVAVWERWSLRQWIA
jgi:low temperature requirement protein LtrA